MHDPEADDPGGDFPISDDLRIVTSAITRRPALAAEIGVIPVDLDGKHLMRFSSGGDSFQLESETHELGSNAGKPAA